MNASYPPRAVVSRTITGDAGRRRDALPPSASVAVAALATRGYSGRNVYRGLDQLRTQLARQGANREIIERATFALARKVGALAVGGCR